MQILKLNLNSATADEIEAVLDQASVCIKQGGLVIYPTETTYGIGVDPGSQSAVDKLLQYKSRREGKPLSIAVSDKTTALRYVEINEQAQKFYERFLPGPYTVVSNLNPQANIDQLVASEFGTLGIRIPDYPLVLQWLKKLNQGITATGANASDKKRPYQISDILEELSERQRQLIDLIIDVGPLPKNEPSVVIDTTLSAPLTLRGQLPTTTQVASIFQSHGEVETKALAGRLLLKNWNLLREKGLIFGLNGELGMGKTIFAKGVAEFLQIQEAITSPTYSYLNEYAYQRHQTQGTFYHLDAWKIDQAEELQSLKLEKLFSANNVLVIECWQQIAAWLPIHIQRQANVLDLS